MTPDEDDCKIFELLTLHIAMRRVVFNAYDWTDTPVDRIFTLNHEEE